MITKTSKTQQMQYLLEKIPKGKITIYGMLAKQLRTSPRAIGRMLNANPLPDKYPCYKIVMSNGSMGGYSGGLAKKLALLKKDGIFVKNGKIVDFEKRLHKF
jgi:O-6-methylguanine DNA methyltransferase